MESSPVLLESIEKIRRGWLLATAGSRSWLLTEETAVKMGLRSGSAVVPAEMDRVACTEQLPRARSDAERYLSMAEHTAVQLRTYLGGRKYHSGVIGEILDWALETGLVDDRRYAEAFVRSHSKRSPMGNFRLRMELVKRGVPSDAVEEVLSDREEDGLYRDLLKEVRGRYAGMERQKALRRASGYLRRRGFDFDLVRRVLEEALGSTEEGPD